MERYLGNTNWPQQKCQIVKRGKNKLKDLETQDKISTFLEVVKHGIRRMASWKTSGPVGVHGFRYKKLSKRHGKISTELQKNLESGTVPEWLTIRRTLLIMKDAKKGKVGTPTTNVEIPHQNFSWEDIKSSFPEHTST